MDGCDLDMAFISGPVGSAGCDGRGTAEESRRQEKKKARRCRGPAANYLNQGWNMVGQVDTDPDRPAQKKMDSIPALNTATGMTEHAPVTQQYNYDSFVDMDSLPKILSDVAGPDALQKGGAPSFFGASVEDSEPSLGPKRKGGLTEAFTGSVAPFVNVIGNEEGYKLLPDFGATFGKAANKADLSGPSPVSQETNYLTPTGMLPNSILPVPNVNVFWKENGIAGGQSSFFSQLKAPGGRPAGSAAEQGVVEDVSVSRREVLTKLDKIFARLDDMDAAKSENAQTEVLLFILTGIGVMFMMDMGCRAASSMVRRR